MPPPEPPNSLSTAPTNISTPSASFAALVTPSTLHRILTTNICRTAQIYQHRPSPLSVDKEITNLRNAPLFQRLDCRLRRTTGSNHRINNNGQVARLTVSCGRHDTCGEIIVVLDRLQRSALTEKSEVVYGYRLGKEGLESYKATMSVDISAFPRLFLE
jgi:hypothetical protein